MANPEHVALVKRLASAEYGMGRWNLWREENPHVLPDFQEADFWHENISLFDFSSANLSGADLRCVNLCNADLTNANLSNAKLGLARLRGATLTGANLRNADLHAADLQFAGLENAQLCSANLKHANLTMANLAKANFDQSTLGFTIFGSNDLDEAIGLDAVVHEYRSVIGLDTFYRSGNRIPESFLRGCGVKEEFIQYLPSFLNEPILHFSCFISYSHEDKAFARLLHDRLQGQGIRCWLDEHQLLPGDDIHDRIDQGIRLWDKVLLCASKSSLTSWWVDGEINRAFQKEVAIMKESGRKVLALIPLNLDGFLFSDDYQSGKKAEIKSRIAANFVRWEKDHALFDGELEKVIRALRMDEGGREKPPFPKL